MHRDGAGGEEYTSELGRGVGSFRERLFQYVPENGRDVDGERFEIESPR